MQRLASRFLLILFSLGIALPVLAQDKAFDVIMKQEDNPTKVDQLHNYVEVYTDEDNKKAIKILKVSIDISTRLGYQKGLAVANRKWGYIKGQEGVFVEAIEHYRKAVYYYNNLRDVDGLIVCYNNIGTNYWQLGKPDSTMYYYLQGIKELEKPANKKESNATRKGRLSTLSLLHLNVGTIYGNLENFEKAYFYSNKALNIAREINDTSKWVQSLAALSHAYEVEAGFREMAAYSQEAIKLASEAKLIIPLAKAYHLLAVAYLGQNKPDSAVYAATRCAELAEKSDAQLYISSLLDMAGAYRKLKNHIMEAQVLEKAIAKHNTGGSIGAGEDLYDLLAKSKYALGEYRAAYDYTEKSRIYRDSLYNVKNQTAVNELEIKYQTAQKERSLSEKQLELVRTDLQLQKSRQYIGFSVGAAGIALLAAALIFVNFRNKKKSHLQQLQNIQQEKEIQLLQATMQGEENERSRIAKDLHDGVAGMLAAAKMQFSSFSIKHTRLTGSKEYYQGIQLLDEATTEVRKTSHNLMPEVLLQHGLNSALTKYCSSISNEQILIVSYESIGVIERYNSNFELSVYRIVQELLNNIIKHSKASKASVQLSIHDNLLSIIIEDNGIGFQTASKPDGMGLHNLASRVKAMNGYFEIEASGKRGVSVYIEFNTSGLSVLPVSDMVL